MYELARTYQNRYLRYQALVDYENAKKQFDRLVELNPSPFVYSARADLLRYSGDLDGAIADLKTALEKSEGDESDDSFRLYRIGEYHEYTDCSDGSVFEGKITGVTKDGLLQVENRKGELKEFAFKEISYII